MLCAPCKYASPAPCPNPQIKIIKTLHIDVIRGADEVFPRGLKPMTDCSSRNICVLASCLSLMLSFRSLCSLIWAILSSRVSVLRCFGIAIASNTSSTSELLKSILERDLTSPFNIFKASVGLPSSTDVKPPRDVVGDIIPLIDDILLSFRSILLASAALPASHSCTRARRSTPIELF